MPAASKNDSHCSTTGIPLSLPLVIRVAQSTSACQLLIKEIRGGVIGAQPCLVPQEVMNLIREYEFGVVDALLTQGLGEPHRFRERHIAVVVAVNQEHR